MSNVPAELKYSKEHEWLRKESDGTYTYFCLCAHFCLKRLREKQDLDLVILNLWRALDCVSDLDILYWH